MWSARWSWAALGVRAAESMSFEVTLTPTPTSCSSSTSAIGSPSPSLTSLLCLPDCRLSYNSINIHCAYFEAHFQSVYCAEARPGVYTGCRSEIGHELPAAVSADLSGGHHLLADVAGWFLQLVRVHGDAERLGEPVEGALQISNRLGVAEQHRRAGETPQLAAAHHLQGTPDVTVTVSRGTRRHRHPVPHARTAYRRLSPADLYTDLQPPVTRHPAQYLTPS